MQFSDGPAFHAESCAVYVTPHNCVVQLNLDTIVFHTKVSAILLARGATKN